MRATWLIVSSFFLAIDGLLNPLAGKCKVYDGDFSPVWISSEIAFNRMKQGVLVESILPSRGRT
jgi:hypothetical protein